MIHVCSIQIIWALTQRKDYQSKINKFLSSAQEYQMIASMTARSKALLLHIICLKHSKLIKFMIRMKTW